VGEARAPVMPTIAADSSKVVAPSDGARGAGFVDDEHALVVPIFGARGGRVRAMAAAARATIARRVATTGFTVKRP
jgi:hypothetical protein